MNKEILKHIEQEAETFYEKHEDSFQYFKEIIPDEDLYRFYSKVIQEFSIDFAKLWAEKYLAEKDNIINTIWNHYKTNGGYTRLAASLIEKITGEKWEVDSDWIKCEELRKQLQAEKERADRLQWISVKDRLPNNTFFVNDLVLFFSKKHSMAMVGCYDDEFSIWTRLPWGAGDKSLNFEDVTHWMPLPENPQPINP